MQLTLDEAATQLGKTVRQVRYMIQQGKLPAKKVGGRWFIASKDLPKSAQKADVADRKQRGLRRVVDDALDLPPSPRRYSVTDLKAFQVALPLHERCEAAMGADHPATREMRRVLMLLSRGCHRFKRTDKAAAYDEARDAASAAVCELVLAGDDGEASQVREGIEQDLMAALAGLLRRLDGRRKR